MHAMPQPALFGSDGPAAYWSLASLLVVAAGSLLGRLLRRLWTTGDESLPERLMIDTAMGLGVLSLAIFALGVFQLYRFAFVICVVIALAGIAGAVCAVQEIRRNIDRHRSERGAEPQTNVVSGTPRPETGEPGPRDRASRSNAWLVAVLLTLLFIASAIPAMTPASMSDWDSLAYHLAVPKLYLQHGGIYRIDIMSHSHFPMLVEMLYIPGLALGIAGAAKMVSFWITVLMTGAIAITASRHFGARSVPMAALAVAGMPLVLWEATTAYIDTSTALYTILAVYYLLRFLDKPERRMLAGCAVAAGFCASTKMTGLAIIPLLVIWLLADRYALSRRLEWKNGLGLAMVAALVAVPWYLKSLIYTGSPVYPFFYSIFGGRGWSAELARRYAEQQALFGVGHDLRSFLLVPFDLTFLSGAFYDKPGLFVGPLMLAALPILFLARCGSRKLIGLLLIFAVHIGIWFALTQQSRYLIPAFALLAILLAGLLYQDDRLRIARGAILVVLAATALFGLRTIIPQIADAAPYVFGAETQDEYLSRTIDVYSAEHFVNTSLPPNARIALYGDTRGFFLNRDYVWADPGHGIAYTRDFRDPAEMAAFLHSRGITHAIINFSDWFPSPDKATGVHKLIYASIDQGCFEPIFPQDDATGHVAVFRIR